MIVNGIVTCCDDKLFSMRKYEHRIKKITLIQWSIGNFPISEILNLWQQDRLISDPFHRIHLSGGLVPIPGTCWKSTFQRNNETSFAIGRLDVVNSGAMMMCKINDACTNFCLDLICLCHCEACFIISITKWSLWSLKTRQQSFATTIANSQ